MGPHTAPRQHAPGQVPAWGPLPVNLNHHCIACGCHAWDGPSHCFCCGYTPNHAICRGPRGQAESGGNSKALPDSDSARPRLATIRTRTRNPSPEPISEIRSQSDRDLSRQYTTYPEIKWDKPTL